MYDAMRLLDHFEKLEDDNPVDTILLLIRRVMGLAWGRFANNHCRRDREYTVFEMPDGSWVGVNCQLQVVLDPAGNVWPWVLVARDRAEWEELVTSQFCPDYGMNMLALGVAA